MCIYTKLYIKYIKVASLWSLGLLSCCPRRPALSISDISLCSQPPKMMKSSCGTERRAFILPCPSSLSAWGRRFPGLRFLQAGGTAERCRCWFLFETFNSTETERLFLGITREKFYCPSGVEISSSEVVTL